MELDEIKTGSEVFIDANIFIYHFTGVSKKCGDFLNRCEQGDLTAITSINVILEVLHRLMMVEAVKKNLVKPPNIVRKLNQSPEKIKGLNEYFLNTQKINEMGIEIRPVTFETVIKSQMVVRPGKVAYFSGCESRPGRLASHRVASPWIDGSNPRD